MSSPTHVHHPDYVKIWALLVVLLIVSVLGPLAGIRWVMLLLAFGIAVVKAYLVAKNFMHVNLQPRWVGYLLIVCLALVVVLFAGVAPDVMKHRGLGWENRAAQQAVEAGSHATGPAHE